MPKAKGKGPEKETKKVAAKKKEVEKAQPAPHVEEVKAEKLHVEPIVHEEKAEHPKQPKPQKPKAQEILYTATGRRKTSIARVSLIPGSGKITINGKPFSQYLAGRRVLEELVLSPLVTTDSKAKFDVIANASGGGVVGQAGAVTHGIARALLQADPELRLKLKPEGLLTRDPREKERKKYGRKKARKRFQYSKR
jgi:small subunit ribosomal protein S9